jgi:predicted Zn-dependent protease
MQKQQPKENSQIRSILKYYENKQYKRGLKVCDQALKKTPNHGETLAMKGLILNSMDRKQEAYNNARKGVRHDLTSHITWHVLGILHRTDRNYAEATLCFKNAIRFDRENQQILRDLAMAQAQLRDFNGMMQTRFQLLSLKSNQRNNWIACAVAAHLKGDHLRAAGILNIYNQYFISKDEEPDFEMSEIQMYHVNVLEEAGDYKKALNFLEEQKFRILDKTSWKEKRAGLLLKLEDYSAAAEQYRELLKLNIENLKHHKGLQAALKLTAATGASLTTEQISGLTKLYAELKSQFPKSLACVQLPLEFLQGDEFKQNLMGYVKPKITKGEPSLFNTLKYLYNNSDRVKWIEQVFLNFAESLEKTAKYDNESLEEPPSSLLWVYVFLAQHFNRLVDPTKALEYIEKAIAHTPTVIDLYIYKACIYQTAGNPQEAAKLMDHARTMDLADRYLNTKCTRFLLRADRIADAEKTISPFTKPKREVDVYQNNVLDMQVSWYEQEDAESHIRSNHYGRALKRLNSIERHYLDITDDQYDFHGYCLRKMTLRSYAAMLPMEDKLFGHDYYFKAACTMAEIYLTLHDKPSEEEDPEFAGLPEDEKKRALANKKKKQRRAEKEARAKAKADREKYKQIGGKRWAKIYDPDPEGKALENVKNPLAKAHKYVKQLVTLSPQKVKTHIVAFEVYLRMKKYLLALRSLKKLEQLLGTTHGTVHANKIRLFAAVRTNQSDLSETARKVFELENQEVYHLSTEAELNKANDDYLAANKGDLSKRVAAAEMIWQFQASQKDKVLGLLTDLTGASYANIKDLQKVHKFIASKFGEKQAQEFKEKVHAILPLSSHFAPAPAPVTEAPKEEKPAESH